MASLCVPGYLQAMRELDLFSRAILQYYWDSPRGVRLNASLPAKNIFPRDNKFDFSFPNGASFTISI